MDQTVRKKMVVLTVCILCFSVLLSGCTEYLFTTQSYRKCKSFSDQFARGGRNYSKQDVYSKLGCPDGYMTEEAGYSRAGEKQRLFDDDVYCWVYDGYEMPDPANPFRMTVTFDKDGKCIDVVFTMVQGG